MSMEETTQIRPIDLEQEMRTSYLDYAMSVIVARALPDVRDGLKPVQRRIVWGMFDGGARSGTAYRKSAGIVGDVMGRYHPHGDSPVYEAMVRLAQDFSMRYPLVDGQGNFGSVDGDPPAAMRYTEARLATMAEELVADIDQNTVDFEPNYDGRYQQPEILPSRLPNLLLNGSSGIAVGMATNIPPHNLEEIVDAATLLIENPQATLDDLLEIVQGPDFPTAGIALVGKEREQIKHAYGEGHGRVTVHARTAVEEGNRGRTQLIITELPYQVNKASLIEKIANLVREKKIEGIADLRDESDRNGMRVVIELKREGSAQQIKNLLYKHTAMRSTFAINMMAIVDGAPRRVGLKRALDLFLDHRREVLRRRSEFQLQKAQEREHILTGLLRAIDMLDQVIATIRGAESAAAALGCGLPLSSRNPGSRRRSSPRCSPPARTRCPPKAASPAPSPARIRTTTGAGTCTIRSRDRTTSAIRTPLNTCAAKAPKRSSNWSTWACRFRATNQAASISARSAASRRTTARVGRRPAPALPPTAPGMRCCTLSTKPTSRAARPF